MRRNGMSVASAPVPPVFPAELNRAVQKCDASRKSSADNDNAFLVMGEMDREERQRDRNTFGSDEEPESARQGAALPLPAIPGTGPESSW